MTFAREAWPFVLPFILLAAAAAWAGWWRWAALLFVLALGVLLFFRIPAREIDPGDGDLLAPASGRITAIERLQSEEIGDGGYHRITTFLSVFDVHVQRSPTRGEVVHSSHRVGRKVAAFRPDAHEVNESHLTVLEAADGSRIGVRQIAGLVARRVVPYLEVGQEVEKGQLLGLIKFGSRVDLYVPASFVVTVAIGDRVQEGRTPIAKPAG
jgi:phosphatidylserine decarboxylase